MTKAGIKNKPHTLSLTAFCWGGGVKSPEARDLLFIASFRALYDIVLHVRKTILLPILQNIPFRTQNLIFRMTNRMFHVSYGLFRIKSGLFPMKKGTIRMALGLFRTRHGIIPTRDGLFPIEEISLMLNKKSLNL
ncbi:MAG: hypothetical protein LBL74_07275 [Bacteroidales bacterium]|jgi:hypothetical protein|nr:hypothetical protein [Bacteroidales bacterium]